MRVSYKKMVLCLCETRKAGLFYACSRYSRCYLESFGGALSDSRVIYMTLLHCVVAVL